jgi:MYXO-CTERM domain-containing protein
MVHSPGDGEGSGGAASTMEYLYNNMTTGSGWVSSGLVNFTTGEGGIPSGFDFFAGAGAQINAPGSGAVVDISFRNLTAVVPAPGALGVLSLAGLAATRRRR